jgi:hypothetical protein
MIIKRIYKIGYGKKETTEVPRRLTSLFTHRALGPSGFNRLGHCATLHSHASFTHIWAARNPTGFFIVPPKRRKQQDVMRHWAKIYVEVLQKYTIKI